MSKYAENAMLIMRVMRHAQAAVKSRFLQQVVPKKLTIVQFNALLHLHWYGGESGMTISELGEHLGLAHSTVSGLVDRLERDAWTIRRKCDTDRRQNRIQLTDKAQQLFQDRAESATDFWHQTIGQLTSGEQEDLIQSLTRLKQVMEKPIWPSYDQLHPRDPGHVKKTSGSRVERTGARKVDLNWHTVYLGTGSRAAKST